MQVKSHSCIAQRIPALTVQKHSLRGCALRTEAPIHVQEQRSEAPVTVCKLKTRKVPPCCNSAADLPAMPVLGIHTYGPLTPNPPSSCIGLSSPSHSDASSHLLHSEYVSSTPFHVHSASELPHNVTLPHDLVGGNALYPFCASNVVLMITCRQQLSATRSQAQARC